MSLMQFLVVCTDSDSGIRFMFYAQQPSTKPRYLCHNFKQEQEASRTASFEVLGIGNFFSRARFLSRFLQTY